MSPLVLAKQCLRDLLPKTHGTELDDLVYRAWSAVGDAEKEAETLTRERDRLAAMVGPGPSSKEKCHALFQEEAQDLRTRLEKMESTVAFLLVHGSFASAPTPASLVAVPHLAMASPTPMDVLVLEVQAQHAGMCQCAICLGEASTFEVIEERKRLAATSSTS